MEGYPPLLKPPEIWRKNAPKVAFFEKLPHRNAVSSSVFFMIPCNMQNLNLLIKGSLIEKLPSYGDLKCNNSSVK